MTHVETIMAFFGCSEREARFIAGVDSGEISGDVVELTEEEAKAIEDKTEDTPSAGASA